MGGNNGYGVVLQATGDVTGRAPLGRAGQGRLQEGWLSKLLEPNWLWGYNGIGTV